MRGRNLRLEENIAFNSYDALDTYGQVLTMGYARCVSDLRDVLFDLGIDKDVSENILNRIIQEQKLYQLELYLKQYVSKKGK